LLAIPIGDTFIYVEPIYLEADQGPGPQAPAGRPQTGLFGTSRRSASVSSGLGRGRTAALPELKRVIVAHSSLLTMGKNLDEALSNILGRQITTTPEAERIKPEDKDVYELGRLAYEYYNKAQDNLRQGNWAEYGRELEKLEGILNELSTISKEKK
jgi:uncharacterized membrane protein (UPF0182 family)